MLRICIFNRTPRKFLCSLANHCNRALINFCLFNLGDFCELINIPLYFSVFALYISNLSLCTYRVKIFSDRLFNPYEYISIILFVPFKVLGGPFQSKGLCLSLALENVHLLLLLLFSIVSVLSSGSSLGQMLAQIFKSLNFSFIFFFLSFYTVSNVKLFGLNF